MLHRPINLKRTPAKRLQGAAGAKITNATRTLQAIERRHKTI